MSSDYRDTMHGLVPTPQRLELVAVVCIPFYNVNTTDWAGLRVHKNTRYPLRVPEETHASGLLLRDPTRTDPRTRFDHMIYTKP